jgi:hypothetical protein
MAVRIMKHEPSSMRTSATIFRVSNAHAVGIHDVKKRLPRVLRAAGRDVAHV